MDARVGAVIEDARPVIRIPERRRFLAQILQRELRITEIQVIEQRCRCRVFRLKNPKFEAQLKLGVHLKSRWCLCF